jgi:hypothetical protein
MQEFRVRDWRIWSPASEARAGVHCNVPHIADPSCAGSKFWSSLGLKFLCIFPCAFVNQLLEVTESPIHRAVKGNGRLLVTREPRGLTVSAAPRRHWQRALALPVFVRRFLLFQPCSTRIPDFRDRQGNLGASWRPAEAH